MSVITSIERRKTDNCFGSSNMAKFSIPVTVETVGIETRDGPDWLRGCPKFDPRRKWCKEADAPCGFTNIQRVIPLYDIQTLDVGSQI